MASPLTILCIDDDPVTVQGLTLILESRGHRVLAAAAKDEVAALARTEPIDIALIEHTICEGQNVCIRELLRDNGCNAKCALHTGAENLEQNTCLVGMPVIPKPSTPEEFIAHINSIASQI